MPRDLDLTWDIATGEFTFDRTVGNYVKRQETLFLNVTVVADGATTAAPTGMKSSLKPVNAPTNTLAQWSTFTQVGATNVYRASTTLNSSAIDTLLGATSDTWNCVFDMAGDGVTESDTLAVVLKTNQTRDNDTAPTALLNRNDFLVTNGTGLLVNVAAGYAANGAFVAAQASLAITNATNYIEVTAAGVASVNTTAFSAGSYPLATVVASAGAITANTDLRAWITPKPATSTGLTVGTTAIASGTSGRILYDNASVLGELPVGTGVATALAVNVGSAGAFLTSAVTSITGTANEITVTGTTTPTLSLPSALTLTGKTVTGGTFNSGAFNGTVGATTPATVAGTTGTFSGELSTTGEYATLWTYGANASIFTNGSNAHILTYGTDAHILTRSTFKLYDGSYVTTLSHAPTAARAIAFPDAAGTLALVSGDLGTPSAIVLTNASGTVGSGLTIPLGTVTLTGSLPDARNTVSNTTTTSMANLATVGTLTGGATGAGFTVALSTSTITGTLADARLSANVPLKDAANTFTAENINSKSGAASVTAMKFSGVPFAGTGTTSFPLVYINDASATASTTLNTAGTYFGVNGDGTQDLMDLMKDGVSACKVNYLGTITLATTSAGVSFGGSVLRRGSQSAGVGIYTSANFFVDGSFFIGAGNGASVRMVQSGNGILTITEEDGSGMTRVNLGGATSSFPALQVTTGTQTITAGLADGTAGGAFVASGTLAVTGATTLTGNLTSNGAYISTPQALSGNGAVAAVNLTTEITTIANTGTANTTTTLAAGTNGQKKVISFITDGGFDAVITVTNPAWGGAGTITMNDALDNIELRYLNSVWQVFINNGCTLA